MSGTARSDEPAAAVPTPCASRSANKVVLDGIDLSVDRRRGHLADRRVRFGQEHAAALHQPARADRRRAIHRRFDGVDISEPGLPPDPVRRRIGMVFQSFNLFPHMSVLDNVTLAPRKVLKRSIEGRGHRAGDDDARVGSGWPTRPTTTPTAARAASSSASPSCERCRWTPR